MSLRALGRTLRTAEFRLALAYVLFFTASAMIIGTLFYWTIVSSLERQMTTRIESEIEILKDDFQSEGAHELLEEVDRRISTRAFEYLVLDEQGKRIAGTLSVTPKLGWSDIQSSSGPFANQHTRSFASARCSWTMGGISRSPTTFNSSGICIARGSRPAAWGF